MAFLDFSSRDYPREHRLEASRDAYAAMAQVELAPRSGAGFHLDARIRLLPGVSLARISCSPMRVQREGVQLADGNDDLVFLINAARRDRWVSALRGRGEHQCGPGEACLIARDTPGYIESAARTRGLLCVSFSRPSLAPMLRQGAAEPGRRLAPNRLLGLMRDYALSLLVRPSEGEAEPVHSAAHLHDLATLLLGGHRDARRQAMSRGLKAARLRAVKADLRAHAWRGDLSLEWVAARHGISARYVRALFASEATSFTDYLLELRLRRAYRQLCQPRQAGTVSAIAYDCGFNNLSWFYRAFKQRFGVTPSELR